MRVGGDVLDRFHQLGEPAFLTLAHRRERDAAVAEHDRRDAVPARRRRVGIPRDLRVEVGVDVDEPGRDVRAARVDLRAPGVGRPRRSTVIRSPSTATSAATGGAPVPSTTVPPRITRSCMARRIRGSPGAGSLACVVPLLPDTVAEVSKGLADHEYLADEGLATAIFLALRLQRPLLLEGEAGVGKTEVAKVLARWTGGELVRLQCYEGIDASQAVYEWDYSRQLLHLRAVEASHERGRRGRALLASGSWCSGRCCAALAHDGARAAGAADRRDRPRRRRVRGVPARDPLRLDDHGARARACPGRGAAGGGAHLEPHPRRARRAQAPLPLPLDRAPRLRARARDRPAARARGARAARARGRGRGRGAPRARAVQAARAWPRRSTGPQALATLGRARLDEARGRRHARHGPQVPRGPGAGARARARRAGPRRRWRAVPDGDDARPRRSGWRSRSRACCGGAGSRCRSARRSTFAEALGVRRAREPRPACTGPGGPRS